LTRKKLTLAALMEIVDDFQCRQCLLYLAASSPEVAEIIVEYLEKQVHRADHETIADELQGDLYCLDLEELWAHSGKTRNGYIDVYEKAYEMFEELIEPYIDEMKKMQELSLFREASEYCMGIMQGIADFSKSDSEFLDWITDGPGESIYETFDTWKMGDKSSPVEQAEVESLYQALIKE
jgi:hypothetical protein